MQTEIPLQIISAIAAAALYFLPAIIADRRQRRDKLTLALFNALFGWTGVGWVLTLYWAYQPNPDANVATVIHAKRHSISMRIFSVGLVERVQRRTAAQDRWTNRHG